MGKAHSSMPAGKHAFSAQSIRSMFSEIHENFFIKHSCFQQDFNAGGNPRINTIKIMRLRKKIANRPRASTRPHPVYNFLKKHYKKLPINTDLNIG
ncbi:hypothetical protein [Burkholderia sp. YIM B11467]